VESGKGGRFEPSAAPFIPLLDQLTVKSKRVQRARHATRIGETRNEYITDHKKVKTYTYNKTEQMVEYVKMSLGETIMKTGGEKNELKFVFNGWLYHKRC
jgi:hypothetical protein